MARWYRTEEIMEMTGVPETTIRRFIKRFRLYIIHERRGRLRYFHEDAIEVIKKIRQRRDAGKTYEQIEKHLKETVNITKRLLPVYNLKATT